MSNDRILHIASERDELLSEEPASPIYTGGLTSLSGDVSEQLSGSDNESELNTAELRATDHVAVNFHDEDHTPQNSHGSL